MKKLLPILVCLAFCACTGSLVFSQSFTVNTNNTAFYINTATELEAVNTLASSFSFSVNSRYEAYNLFTGVTSISFTPSTTEFATIPLEVKLHSVTGVSTSGAVTGEVPLLEYPPSYSTLAYNATRTTPSRTAVWTYDLILNPIGYTIPPGNYNFVVTVLYADEQTTIVRSFTVTLNVQPVLQLNLVQNASTTVSFTGATQYNNGVTYNGFTTHSVKSNRPWLVNVKAQSNYFTPASSGADNNMPCSVVSFKATGTSAFLPLSLTAKTIKTGNAGNSTATGNNYSVDAQFNPGYSYNAGIYNIGITYTLTNQ